MTKQNKHTFLFWKQLHRSPTLMEPAKALFDPSADITDQLNLLVFSPALNAYVMWLLRKAMEDGIQRLYFLARDGYLVYLTAQQYCQALNLPMDCRYLYCSRYSLRIPLYHTDLEGTLEHICRGGLRVTPTMLLIRSGFLPEEIPDFLRKLDLPYADDECIPHSQLSVLREILASNREYMDLLRMRSAQRLPALRSYFAQEGLFEDCPIAIVDCGWTGSTQRSIQNVMDLCGAHVHLQGYYYGLFSLPSDVDPVYCHAFAFAPKSGLMRKVFFNNNVFETVFSAPHGSTIGYEDTDGVFSPILSEPDALGCDLVKTLERCLRQYTGVLLSGLNTNQFLSLDIRLLRDVSCGLFRILMCSPTPEEAACLGKIPFSDDLMDSNRQHLAAELSGDELRGHHFLPKLLSVIGWKRQVVPGSAWYEASAVLHGRHSFWNRMNYTLYKLALYLLPR